MTSTTSFSQRRGCKPIFVQPSKARPDGAAWDDAISDNVRTHLICDKDLFEMTDDARRHQHLLRLGQSQTSCLVCEFMDVLGDFSASQFGLPARQVLLCFFPAIAEVKNARRSWPNWYLACTEMVFMRHHCHRLTDPDMDLLFGVPNFGVVKPIIHNISRYLQKCVT